jgi:MFS transporter, DHA3 family, macrolide efflux protein
MFVFTPLRDPRIARLWCGQVLSAVGDELYKVALIWIAVDLIGFNAGYVSATQSLAIILFGVVAGVYADRLSHKKLMFWSDIIRGIAVLIPPITFYFFGLSLPVLLFVAVIIASLYTIFDPALIATLPVLAKDRETLLATNGLFGSTPRMARVLGPTLIALLSKWLLPIHFFVLDSISFFLSAFAVRSVSWEEPLHDPLEKNQSHPFQTILNDWKKSFLLMKKDKLVTFGFFSSACVWGTWSLGFSLGLALLVQKEMGLGLDSYAFALLSYGLGNLTSNLFWGSCRIERPERVMFSGELLMGIGFIFMAYAPSVSLIALCAGIAAAGGPMDDLSFQIILQRHFSGKNLGTMFRIYLIGGHTSILFFFLLSPTLFDLIQIRHVIAISGFLMTVVASIGLYRFAGQNKLTSVPAS